MNREQSQTKPNQTKQNSASPSPCIRITNIPWVFVCLGFFWLFCFVFLFCFTIPGTEDTTSKNSHFHESYILVKRNIGNMKYVNTESDVLW